MSTMIIILNLLHSVNFSFTPSPGYQGVEYSQRLIIGMTKEQLIAAHGLPKTTNPTYDYEGIEYNYKGKLCDGSWDFGCVIVIRNNTVTSWRYIKPIFTE